MLVSEEYFLALPTSLPVMVFGQGTWCGVRLGLVSTEGAPPFWAAPYKLGGNVIDA